MVKKILLLFGLAIFFLVLIILLNKLRGPQLGKSVAFEVTIPTNTPEGDTVHIYLQTQKHYKMEKVGDFTYRVVLTPEQLAVEEGATLRYRYSRNGYDFRTAEYLEPDTDDYFWTEKGRTATYRPGETQKDKIGRWRFFPEEGVPIVRTTDIEPTGDFLPRVDGIEFRSGQTIEDLYAEAFHDFFASTAKHIKSMGYNWVEIDPPWQWIEVAGLPKVSNEFQNNPNYPDDETFLEEVRTYKDEGLKVLIAPQLCCTALDTKNKSQEWWDAYFAETEKFLVHFATLAQEAGAEAFSYAIASWDFEGAPLDLEKEWRRIITSIKEVFEGEIGEMVWMGGPDVSPSPSPIPDTEFIQWADLLDFILVHTDFPLSEKDNSTDEELKKGSEAVLDGMKVLYDKFKKPIIVRNGYFNVRYSWKGQAFYQIDSVPWISDPEAKLKESIYEFDTADHARTIHAYFRAIAERPWVVGYFHFGYTHWEDPLSPWMSVRGKPAEDLWRKWNKIIYGP